MCLWVSVCPCIPGRVPERVWEILGRWGQGPKARPSPEGHPSLQKTLHESLMNLSVCLGTCPHIHVPARICHLCVSPVCEHAHLWVCL